MKKKLGQVRDSPCEDEGRVEERSFINSNDIRNYLYPQTY